MQIWKTHYQDPYHDTMIEIINTEEDYKTDPLSFTLDGVKFIGTGLDAFELADDSQYDSAKEKFCILKAGGYTFSDHHFPYWYALQRYSLDLEIPVKIVRKRDNSEVQGNIHITFTHAEPDIQKQNIRVYCDDVRVYPDDVIVKDFTLHVNGVSYSSSKKTLYFESALEDICKQMKNEYYMKCCFTCQYSEYSPYGNDNYGSMLCYCRHKEDCLKVSSKGDYFQYLEDKDFDMRQETYLCEEYAIRNKIDGYRGFVPGIDINPEFTEEKS